MFGLASAKAKDACQNSNPANDLKRREAFVEEERRQNQYGDHFQMRGGKGWSNWRVFKQCHPSNKRTEIPDKCPVYPWQSKDAIQITSRKRKFTDMIGCELYGKLRQGIE